MTNTGIPKFPADIRRTAWVPVLAAIWIGAGQVLRGAAAPETPEPAAVFTAAVRADTKWLGAAATRMPGTADHDRVQRALFDRVRAIPGVRVWTRSFPLVVPQFTNARLHIDSGAAAGDHRVYPIWPAVVRLPTTPAAGIRGPLVYVGEGKWDELRPKSLRGAIAVMEADGADHWTGAATAGAAAILFLGNSRTDCRDAQANFLPIPVYVPRYYIPDGPLARALRHAGSGIQGRIVCRGKWKKAHATDLWALVPARGGKGGQKALAVLVQTDAAGVVPELSPGADQVVDTALGLELLRHYARHPASRPLLFVFLDGQCIDQLGEREFLGTLATTAKEQRPWLEQDRKTEKTYAEHEALAERLEKEPDFLNRLWKPEFRALHQYVKDEVSREVVGIETVLYPKRLKLHHAAGALKEKLRREVDALDLRRSHYYATQLRMLTARPLDAGTRELSRVLWHRARARMRAQLRQTRARIQEWEKRNALRRALTAALGLPKGTERPLEFALGLDISDAGVAAGPLLYGRFLYNNESANAAPFTRWLSNRTRSKNQSPVFPRSVMPGVDLTPLSGMDSPDSFAVGDVATLTAMCQSFGTAGATWATLDAMRLKADTPLDTVSRLAWDRLTPQIEAVFYLLKSLANDADFQIKSGVVSRWTRAQGFIVDQATGEPVARLPLPGYLATLAPGSCANGRGGIRFLAPVAGIRRFELHFTNADGTFYSELLPAQVGWAARGYYVQAFDLAPDGRIIRAVDLKKGGKGINLNFDVRSHDPTPMRAVMFTCASAQAFDLFDPRFLIPLPMATMLDARRGSEPRRLNFQIGNGMFCAQLEPETRWELILRAGVTRNRLALLNVDPPSEWHGRGTRKIMRGFAPDTPFPKHPLLIAAQDLYRLDERRLEEYEKAGITSKPIRKLRQRTGTLLEKGKAAFARDDGAGFYQATEGALANEVRAYQAVRDMANDVIRGAIFLLLALAPFAYAMERLIFASPHVYRQIAGVLGIFAGMTVLLVSFHPAFRITAQPLMIIMAFAIILMSALVISVVFSKFESGLEEIRSGRAESSAAQTSRLGVLSTAVRLGIANMRKRKLRTALTGITIMLVTFALLCFTSTSHYVGQKEYEVHAKAPYSGVLVRQPSSRPMPEQAYDYLVQAVAGHAGIVRRYWWCNPWNAQWRIHIRNPKTGKEVSLLAGLGLDPAEARLTRIAEFCKGWTAAMKRNNACYLASGTAEELGLGPGDPVIVAGRTMVLAGIYDAAAMDRGLKDLDGQSLLPMDYSALGDEQRRMLARGDIQMLAVQMETGAGMEPDRQLPRVPASNLIILPAEMLRGTGAVSLRSLALGTPDEKAAHALTMELAQRLAFPIYYGGPATGVHVVATTPLLPKAPKSLIIPLAIAALIIFNTMLSSIAERRREIYIYTSLGLAPLHVGFLFLAEAITYGLMGSIFGYIVGQGVATVFSKMGWMGGITLNYSGTQAIAVMVMVLAVVVISSLIPAYLAGKLAAPSNEMNWAVPEPDGDVIRDALPFTSTPRTANAIMMYLYEYLDAHREGAIGNFSTDNLSTFRISIQGQAYLGLEATVWLAPYDLGVRQHVRFLVVEGDAEDVLGLRVELTRQSGQVRSWHKLNRVFLGDLRRQLLGWRRLKAARILAYIGEARQILSGAAAEGADEAAAGRSPVPENA